MNFKYEAIVESAADGFLLLDPGGKPTFSSPGWEALLGLGGVETGGRGLAHVVHPDDFARVLEVFRRARAGETGLAVTYRARRGDGSWRWLESRPAPARQGAAPGSLVDVVRDVTEQAEREAALRQALAEAEAAVAAKAQFLANMSHEIRTPLTAVIGFADLLATRNDLQPDALGHVERIGAASRALLAVVNDILDISKLEAGQYEIRPTQSRPVELAGEALAMFAAAAAGKGVALRLATELSPSLTVMLDGARLRQVLLNLIGNAVKFTTEGSVEVRLTWADGQLFAAVRDTGPGLFPEQQEKLFRRFSQVDDSLGRRDDGTGLGLAISKALVEAMGGTIGLRSAPGDGSMFYFEVPALEVLPIVGLAAEAAAPAPVTEERGAAVRVLVADDNPMNRELVRAVLTHLGVEVSEAQDGREAVAIAAQMGFDMILMDLRMPGLDGRAALQEIRRAAGPNQTAPVLAFSADDDAPGLAEAGFTGCVSKPIQPGRLAEALQACLSGDPVG